MENQILDQKGQALTEYLTILILVSVLAIGITGTLGKTIQSKIKQANDRIVKIKVAK